MTTPRLPTVDDLPKNLLCDILPSRDGKNTNILILLHGLGDTKNGFTQLGEILFAMHPFSSLSPTPLILPAPSHVLPILSFH